MRSWLIIIAVALAGCTATPSTSSPPASSSPTFTCFLAGATPSPCSQAEYDKVEQQNALAAEAEKVYRRYFAEHVRIMRAGGVTKATSEMKATLAEDALVSALAVYENYSRNDVRFIGGSIELKTLLPNFSLTENGSTVMQEACWDARSVKIRRNGQDTGRGQAVGERAFLKPVNGQLKIVVFFTRKQKSC